MAEPYRNHHLNYSGNELIHAGQRRNTSSVARMRFRVRTLLASLLFVCMMGSIIHVINVSRPGHSSDSSGNTGNVPSGQLSTVAALGSYAGTHAMDSTAMPRSSASSIVRKPGKTNFE